jgi:hypothetical protein
MLAIITTDKSVKFVKDGANVRTVNVGLTAYSYSEKGVGFYFPNSPVAFIREAYQNLVTLNGETITYENVEEKLNEVFFLSSVSPEELDAAIAKEVADRNAAIAAALLATQKWLPSVNSKADLPDPQTLDSTINYLCRVTGDPVQEDNGVYQLIAGSSEWTFFSNNADFIDEQELEDALEAAIGAHNESEEAHQDIRTDISEINKKFNDYVASDVEERLSYGVEIDITAPSPLLRRIGNPEFHRTLPIQSKIVGCLQDNNGNVVEYLNPNSWLGHDRTGASGQVMVRLPGHYRKFEAEGTKIRTRISEVQLPGYHYVKEMYISAYEASMQRSTGMLCSVVNLDPDFRGGNNQADWDGTYRSLLGRPVTSQSRTQFRNAARLRGAGAQWNCMDYTAYKTLVWFYLIEYANRNSQAAFNAQPDANGYKQGGLGNGVTNLSSAQWNTLNGYYPFIPCGYTDSLGNASGEVLYNVDINGYGSLIVPTYVNRYRGIENPFGHIFKIADGINIEVKSDAEGGTSKVFVSTNPADYTDTGYENYEMRGLQARYSGYIKSIIIGKRGDIVSTVVGGSSSTYWCDNFYANSNAGLRIVLLSGTATNNDTAGLFYMSSTREPSNTDTNFGSRLCFIPK